MSKNPSRALPLLAGALIQLCIGIIYIWSIFKKPFIEYYSAHVTADFATTCASLTYSLMLAFFVLGIVIGGRINDKKGPRMVVLMGGLLFFSGIFLSFVSSSFLPQYPWLICIFYGCIAGFGVGAAYTSTISCAQKWFMDKKGFATGVIVCAFGASTVIFTPLANTLLVNYGLPQTFMIMSLLFLAIIMIFTWFIKNPTPEYMKQHMPAISGVPAQKQYTPSEVLKSKQYYVLLCCMILITPSYFILNPLFKSLAESRGLVETAALASVMVTGIASACGRLVAPWLSDRIGRKNVIFLLFILTIAAVLLLIFAQGYAYMALIALIAFGFGGSAGVFPAVAADSFGTQNIGVNYGLVMIGFAFSALVFPAVASTVNVGGEPTALTFIIPAVACVAGLIATSRLKSPQIKKADAKN